MVSSILQESRISVADVEAALQALDSPKKTTALNTLNLLRIVPLDGGRYVEAVVFARAPLLRAVFNGIAGLIVAATRAHIESSSPVLR